MSRLPLRLATVAVAAAALPALASSPAAAGGNMFFSKTSGTTVSTTWLEAGTLPGVAGNWHFGDLFVEATSRGRAQAFGAVFDVTCADGVLPYNPGGHGGLADVPPPPDQEEPGCVLEGIRFLDASPSQLTLTVDRKLTTATLKGSLSVGDGHGSIPGAQPPVDIVLVGVGPTFSSIETGTFTDEYGTYRYRYSFSGRDAAVADGSRIGGMVFDDEPGESSSALMGTFRSSSRQRT